MFYELKKTKKEAFWGEERRKRSEKTFEEKILPLLFQREV